MFIIGVYGKIRARCGGNGFALLPISYRDIEGWEHHMGVELTHWERETLFELDSTRLKLWA